MDDSIDASAFEVDASSDFEPAVVAAPKAVRTNPGSDVKYPPLIIAEGKGTREESSCRAQAKGCTKTDHAQSRQSSSETEKARQI